MTIKTATYAIIILRNKNIMWEIASIHQLTSHPRVKISNLSKNVLFDLSVLMARELSKAYFLSLLMIMILHITYIVINFEIDMFCSSTWSLPTSGVSLKKIPGVLLIQILFQQMKLKHQNQRQEYQKGLGFEQVFFLGTDWMDKLLKFLLEEVRLQISGQRGPQCS